MMVSFSSATVAGLTTQVTGSHPADISEIDHLIQLGAYTASASDMTKIATAVVVSPAVCSQMACAPFFGPVMPFLIGSTIGFAGIVYLGAAV
jgi:hypothetical protein